MSGTTNSQIVDSVTTTSLLVGGQAPSQSFGMLDTVMAETLGMAMHNAVMRQQASGTVNAAAVTAACARMLQAPTMMGGPPARPDPTTPPGIQPIEPPSQPGPFSTVIKNATNWVTSGLTAIKDSISAGEEEAKEGQSALDTIKTQIGS